MLTKGSVRIYFTREGYYVIESFDDILGRRFHGNFWDLVSKYDLVPDDAHTLAEGVAIITSAR